ncbi:MAG: LacI family transcriptional regulator [Lentisphaerae bacterium]|nr:MAG: LacI family transcriptional regulator [Lentisphaerota bacterium]
MDTYLPDVYRAARATGLKIPEDVSVIGYGNLPLRNYLEPKPASIDQNPYQVGIRAAEMMFDRIDGEKELPETVKSYIPTRLVPGESVAEVRH